MKKKAKFPFTIVLAALSCILAAILVYSWSGDPFKGRLAPAFSLKDRNGKDFRLEDLRGKPVVIYFWSTWAPPSRLGITQMVRVQADYRKRNLAVVGVAVRDEARPVARFLREVPVNFPVVIGTTLMEDSYFGGKGVKLPMTLVLDAKGVVRERVIGYQSREDMNSLLDRMPELSK
jgi:peroxiredoxin